MAKETINPDILNATDFTFMPFNTETEGDSGALYLATSKEDPSVQYVVKFETPELACNEFMYHKIATALGLYTQEVKFFTGINASKYAAGIRFSPNAQKYNYDMNDKKNHTDFYAFQTLYVILNEEDSQEFYIDEQEQLFKLDNAASFNIDANFIYGILKSKLFIDFYQGINNVFKSKLAFTEYSKYKLILEILSDRFGNDGECACISMFKHFANLDIAIFEEAFHTLNTIYSTKLSAYYLDFIQIRKIECMKFLLERGVAMDDKTTFTTIDEYISMFTPETQSLLVQMRETVRKFAPDAQEKISWQMPTFYQNGNLVHFAAFKKHIGFYPGAEAMEHFKDKMSEYKTSKGAVQLPFDKPLPLELVEEIVRFRVGQNELKSTK